MTLATGIFHRLAMNRAVRTKADVWRDHIPASASPLSDGYGNPGKAHVVVEVVSFSDHYYMDGEADIRDPVIQVTVYAATPEEREHVGRAVKDCLVDYSGRLDEVNCHHIERIGGGDRIDMNDDGSDAAAYVRRQDFRVWATT